MIAQESLYGVSLVAAFIAGMIALFAPCCISYLLPAYLGNVFKERHRVLLMTFIYSLGILVVILPVVLGARALASFFFRAHDYTYLIGGIFMLVVAVFSFLGIKLPMPHFKSKNISSKPDMTSTFTLGIISGITSACCAPVLVGVMALSALSPSSIQSLGVGVAYVLGMVTPLYLAATVVHEKDLLENPWLKKKVTTLDLFGQEFVIFVSNLVASGIFFLTGMLTLVLLALGKLSMPSGEESFVKVLNQIAMDVTAMTNKIPGINIVFLLITIWLLRKFFKKLNK
jgi:cytochrome c-type biogenesis protein